MSGPRPALGSSPASASDWSFRSSFLDPSVGPNSTPAPTGLPVHPSFNFRGLSVQPTSAQALTASFVCWPVMAWRSALELDRIQRGHSYRTLITAQRHSPIKLDGAVGS